LGGEALTTGHLAQVNLEMSKRLADRRGGAEGQGQGQERRIEWLLEVLGGDAENKTFALPSRP